MARGWDKERAVVNTVMNRVVQQTEGFIDWLKNCQLLKFCWLFTSLWKVNQSRYRPGVAQRVPGS